MNNTIRSFALPFAAMVALFVLAATAQAQGRGQSICRDVWDWSSGRYVQVCNDVYYPPPSPPLSPEAAAEPPAKSTTGTESTIRYNADAEERKAQLQAIERGGAADRGSRPGSSLCPPPYRMTARDGCQR